MPTGMLKQIGLIIATMGIWLAVPTMVGAQAQSQPTIQIKVNIFNDKDESGSRNAIGEGNLNGWNIETYTSSLAPALLKNNHHIYSTQLVDQVYTISAEAEIVCVEPVYNWIQTTPLQTAILHPRNNSWFCHQITGTDDAYNFGAHQLPVPDDDASEEQPTFLPPVIIPGPSGPTDPNSQTPEPDQPTDPDTTDPADPPSASNPSDQNSDSSVPDTTGDAPEDTSGAVLGATDDNTDTGDGEVLAENDTNVLAETGRAALAIVLTGAVVVGLALASRKTRVANLLYHR